MQNTKSVPLDITERFLWTFIEAGVAALPITLSLTGTGTSIAGWTFLTAGVAAVIALAKNLLLKPPTFSTNSFLGVVERFAWTGIQAFIGSLPATISLSGHSLTAIGYSGLVAAIAAIVALAKNITVVPTALSPITSVPSSVPASGLGGTSYGNAVGGPAHLAGLPLAVKEPWSGKPPPVHTVRAPRQRVRTKAVAKRR